MILTTTPTIEGHPVKTYLGVVSGETIFGTNVIRDIVASVRDLIGGRSTEYEEVLLEAKKQAMAEMQQRAMALGANAIVGIDYDYESVGQINMMMVSVSGTAVII